MSALPIQQTQHQRPRNPQDKIHDRVFQSAHHVSAEEMVREVFVEFPEDRRGPCAGKGENDLDGERNIPNDSLRVADEGTIKIRDRHAAHEMRGNIQDGIQVIETECQPEQIKPEHAQRRPGGFF